MIALDKVVAIDVHAHVEVGRHGEDGLRPEWREAAARYFGDAPTPTVDEVAAYYRERNMAAVVFSVDAETVTGRAAAPNEEIAEGAAANADVLIPFASVDPHRPDAVERVRRLTRDHGVRGFKFHPNIQAFFPNDRGVLPCLRGDPGGGRTGALPHRPLRDRHGPAGRRRDPPEVLEPDVRRRRGGRLPGTDDRPCASVLPVAGRGDLGRAPQAAGVHRPLRLVAEVLPAATRPLREHAAPGPRAVRFGLPDDHARSLARRLRGGRVQGRGASR